MRTRKFRNMKKSRKRQTKKGGFLGVKNPFKTHQQNVNNWRKYWQPKPGNKFAKFDRRKNYLGMTNGPLMEPTELDHPLPGDLGPLF